MWVKKLELEDFVIKGEFAVFKNDCLQIETLKDSLNAETLDYLKILQKAYFENIENIAQFCVNDFNFKFFLGNLSVDYVKDALKSNQRLFYDGENGFIYFDVKVKNFGRLAIKFNNSFENLTLEDECCEASGCEL